MISNQTGLRHNTNRASLSLYWHTLRNLRPVQLYGRVWFWLHRPLPDTTPAPGLRPAGGLWARPASRLPSLLGSATFRFLNETRRIEQPGDWGDPRVDKLWRYHLHYFDDLNAENATTRKAWHRDLMMRWVLENLPGQGTAWEPYPTSLRIVNWIKWTLTGNELSSTCRQSLAIQARWLSSRLETHLQGNHLFANAKALMFAGLFFDGAEASRWLEKGLSILEREIPEQILKDGGQFERSPMYHALALEDMLDMINVMAVYPGAVPEKRVAQVAGWPEIVGRMRRWLAAMCHPDGEISFFNDAAMGMAPSLVKLEEYAMRLGFVPYEPLEEGVTHFPDSGYIRLQRGPLTALLDVAPVGPDYLPGHAHADTLSFELSLFGQRLIVNSGTSCYGRSLERLRQRGTAAHNTVIIDDQDSSEVWSGFRVARRARPEIVSINEIGRECRVEACHDGYTRLPGNNVHRRSWIARDHSLNIYDRISGSFDKAEARFYLHPDIEIEKQPGDNKELVLALPQEQKVRMIFEGGTLRIEATAWHPLFGCSQSNFCLIVNIQDPELKTVIEWDESR